LDSYAITYVNGTLTVTWKQLTVTADNVSKVYGQADPAYTYRLSGFANGDKSSAVSGAPAFSVSGTAGTARPVGSYTITPSLGTLTAANYSFTLKTGALTVTPAALIVTANNASKAYGQPDPAAYTASYSGFVNGENAGVISGAPAFSVNGTAGAARAAGSYTITPSLGTLAAANYSFGTFNPGTLTVNAASLTITASSWTKPYGTLATFAGVEFTASGLLNGDTVSGVTLASAGAPVAANVGPYAIVPSSPVGTGLGNYTIAYVNGTLTVAKKALTVTASNAMGRRIPSLRSCTPAL
jgi:hypothetical protein